MRSSALLLLASALLSAQTSDNKPKFEVVSIKPSTETMVQVLQSGREPIKLTETQATYVATPLSMLLQMAFRLPDDQIVAPSWLAGQRFDIAAKLPAGSSREQPHRSFATVSRYTGRTFSS